MISSSTTNDLTFSMNYNDRKTERSAYDNLNNSIHDPLTKKFNQNFFNEEYDNYPIISNQQENPLGKFSFLLF
jgi:hypothetical protein